MFLKAWRFITIILTALLMTMGFAHLWQMPTRLTYDGSLWFTTLNMYQQFGPGGPGPFIEIGAIVSTIVLLFLLRDHRMASVLALVAAISLLAAFAAWWVLVHPVNVEMLNWTAESLPANWMEYRDRWEYAHAARAVFQLIALSGLVLSMLVEIPSGRANERAPYSIGERRQASA